MRVFRFVAIIGLVNVVGILLVLLLAELAVRHLQPPALADVYDPLPYRLLPGYMTYEPNTEFSYRGEEGEVNISTDRLGLRNPEVQHDRFDVVVLGDSFIAAVNTEESSTLVGQLRDRGLKVLNGGLDGSGTFSQLRLFRDHLHDIRANSVVLAFYLGNDFHDNYLTPSSISSAATPYVETPAPTSEASNDSDPGFDFMRWDTRALCAASALCTLVDREVIQPYLRGKSTDPMASYATSEMLALIDGDPGQTKSEGNTLRYFQVLCEIAAQRDLDFFVLGIPSKAQVLKSFREISKFGIDSKARPMAREIMTRPDFSWDRPNSRARELAEQAGMEYFSLLAVFRESASEELFGHFDVHWNAAGQRAAAEYLARILESRQPGPPACRS